MRPQQGFTLLEILVALAIIAIALIPTLNTVATYSENSSYLRDQTFAHWIAMNKLTEMQVSKVWPSQGSRASGKTEMADQLWYWSYEIQATPEPAMRRINLEVKQTEKDEAPIAILTGFLGQPTK